uniref:Tripartite motif containing 14 n=2 Tax=Nothobranchius korthausae TaxID=1143690 RepID=A0A1A8FH00_9TELE
MGAALDTPTRCPLCNDMTGDPVTLKCNHRFCQRCIGDLWSVAPNGPYHCPEWRCKTVYQTLPFDKSLIQTRIPGKRAAHPAAAGTSANDKQSALGLELGRPSLTSRLLGKRKASAPVSEQHATKKATPSDPFPDTGISTSSLSDKPRQSTPVLTSKVAASPASTQSDHGDGTFISKSSDSKVPPNDELGDFPVRQNQHKSDDSDSSSEVDLCDAPHPSASKKETGVTGSRVSPKKPILPASSNSNPGVSDPGRKPDPPQQDSKSPLSSTKSPAAASGPLSRNSIFLRPQNKTNSPVPCHYCPKAACQPAVKTCLVCGASMCKEHLRPHLDSPVFQNHSLVPPVEDISLWRCQEHQEINRIYCRQCSVCVCTVCTVIGHHRDHVFISIREAETELRTNLKDEIKHLQEAEQKVKNRLAELTGKKETFRVDLTEAQERVKQQYGAIREALEQEEQSALQCVTKEENRVLGGLEKKLGVLQRSLQSIQSGLHTLENLADAREDTRIQDQAFIMEYSRTSELTNEVGNCAELFEAPEEVDHARLNCLQRWTERRLDKVVLAMPGKDGDLYRLLYGTIPVLDADTAHPKLQLSDNNRSVAYADSQQAYVEHEGRFSSFPQVLASSALKGGRWYWEVMVCVDDGRWKVGVCEGQIERKGQKDSSRLGFNSYSWCLACEKKKVEALHGKESVPVKADGLQRVGVFLDFEEGSLSFFNVTSGGSLALLYSYRQRFSEPLYPALSVSKTHLTICDLF